MADIELLLSNWKILMLRLTVVLFFENILNPPFQIHYVHANRIIF